MARPKSTEQEIGASVCVPRAVSVIRELAGSCRYRSFSGRCSDRISMNRHRNLKRTQACCGGGPRCEFSRRTPDKAAGLTAWMEGWAMPVEQDAEEARLTTMRQV